MKKALTVKVIDNLPTPTARRLEVRDSLLPGFGIRVTIAGRKSWFVVGRVGRSQMRHTIGTYPVLSLADARQEARAVLATLQLGTYVNRSVPVPEALTFGQASETFVEKYAKPKNRDWLRTKRILDKFAMFNHKPLIQIRRADVLAVLDGMVAAGTPIRANRALAAIKKLFAWALDRGLVEVHPIVGLKPVGKETRRERVLGDAEIAALWAACEVEGFPFGRLTQLLLLTGQRRGEVTSMRWSDVDFDRAIWTIPGAVAKNGRAHEVPLSPQALAILTDMPAFAGSDLVFTTTGKTPVSGFGRAKDRLDYALGSSDWRMHDLRRTAASGMARYGIAPHVIEKVLNHVSGQISGVAAVYNRHGYEAEKRLALERWANRIA